MQCKMHKPSFPKHLQLKNSVFPVVTLAQDKRPEADTSPLSTGTRPEESSVGEITIPDETMRL